MNEIKNFEDVCRHLRKPFKQIKFLRAKRFCNRLLMCKFDLGYTPEKKIKMIAQAISGVEYNNDCLWLFPGSSQLIVFPSEAACKYAATTFEKEYKQYLSQ